MNTDNKLRYHFLYQLESQFDDSKIEDYGYDDDDAPLVIREEDPNVEETLDRIFGELPLQGI